MTYETLKIPVSPDVTLYARLYRGGKRTPAICIPGLTRNAKDFIDSAPIITATGRDVIVVNLRGRGASDNDPDYLNYHPNTYRDDILKVLDHAGINEAVFVGTSLGGITTMLVNEVAPNRVKAAILNDIGPELAPEGIARIADYVGGATNVVDTIEIAVERIRTVNGVAFPDASDEEWLKFAKRTFRQEADGTWILDYDPNIARALMELGPAPDLWPAFESLRSTPTLVVHGAISDLLTTPIIEKMRARHPDFEYVAVPRIGHAPMLTEPAARRAVEAFLAVID
ncbi:MAG: alpha/beta hydrolase [Marinicaulis sp.]|nr:alpha/beta hydrolase [Marinicaulis sp.]